MYKFLIAFICIIATAKAHEGHDHGPSTVIPQKGGIVRSLETVSLELVVEGKTIKIFVFDKDKKPADVSKYPSSLTVVLPKKKPENLVLVAKGDHWEFSFDPKNTHRFNVELAIKQAGHNDKVKWTIEPKRK